MRNASSAELQHDQTIWFDGREETTELGNAPSRLETAQEESRGSIQIGGPSPAEHLSAPSISEALGPTAGGQKRTSSMVTSFEDHRHRPLPPQMSGVLSAVSPQPGVGPSKQTDVSPMSTVAW